MTDNEKSKIYSCIQFLKSHGYEVIERNDHKIGKWVAYKRKGMKPVLHGKVIYDYGGTYCVKKKNASKDFIGLDDVIDFYDDKIECYSVR